ncbi:hypothetical protein EON82_10135 [bacterium]|nr:MAG: hypothetical protein EON82_10135 [bacterium]
MFPILPILILLLLGPANAERLAVEGRLPAALLAAHRSMVAPIRATVVAPVEEEAPRTVARQSVRWIAETPKSPLVRSGRDPLGFNWSCPTRAGP